MNRLAVDPGITFGWALWPENRWKRPSGPFPPYSIGTHNAGKAQDWFEANDIAAAVFRELIKRLEVHEVWCEFPHFFESNKAAARTGALTKLMCTTGRFMEIVVSSGAEFIPVPPNEWMGQMKPPAIRKAIARRLGDEFAAMLHTHTLDAVGIGLHAQEQWIPK